MKPLIKGYGSKDSVTFYFREDGKFYKQGSGSSVTNYFYKGDLLIGIEFNLLVVIRDTNHFVTDSIYGNNFSFLDYNDKGQLVRATASDSLKIVTVQYKYNRKGYLTDYIYEQKKCIILDKAPFYSWKRLERYHTKYKKFDKYGNWRKCYFMTPLGRRFYEKRVIEYWEDK